MLNLVNGWSWCVKQLEQMILTGDGIEKAAAIPNADGTGDEVVINAILEVLRDRGFIEPSA